MSKIGVRFRLRVRGAGRALSAGPAWAQRRSQRPPGPPATPQAAPPKDPLGRDTPRGTVLGFMNAARDGRDDVAPLYLNTSLRDRAAADLARKLFVVLDSRLPARLERAQRSAGRVAGQPPEARSGHRRHHHDRQRPAGPRRRTREPWRAGPGVAVLTQDARGHSGRVRRSRSRLGRSVSSGVPDEAPHRGHPSVRSGWCSLLIFPLSYRLTGLLGRLLRPVIVAWRRRRGRTGELPADLVPGSVRLLLLALADPMAARQSRAAAARAAVLVGDRDDARHRGRGVGAAAVERGRRAIHPPPLTRLPATAKSPPCCGSCAESRMCSSSRRAGS